MSETFKRPFYNEYLKDLGIQREPTRAGYPYPAKMFGKYDIFPLIILDGGAFLFTNEHLGGAEGKDFIKAFNSGKLLRPWMRNGKLDWDCIYDENAPKLSKLSNGNYGNNYGVWLNSIIPVEQHVWLNRFMFLLPIAHQAFLTKRKKWADIWCHYFFDWLKMHPYPLDVASAKEGKKYLGEWEKTKFIWYDMEVTWRLLVLIHSTFLLSHVSDLTKPQWHSVYDAIIQCVSHVHKEAAEELKHGGWGNHFLQKGTALLYAGLLFPEMPDAKKWISTGGKIIARLMKTDILRDGGSIETCPSYSHFIARLFLDAYLLLQANRQPAIRGLKASILRQYDFLSKTMAPSGKTLQLSDSYALDARLDLAIVSQLLRLKKEKARGSVFFKDSCMAVLRNEQMTAYLDGTPLIAGHAHRGKPNLLLYIKGQPAIVDPGSPNYDSPERWTWFKSAHAHNTVRVEPAGCKSQNGKETIPDIRMIHSGKAGKISDVTMEVRTPFYTLLRTLRLTPQGLEVIDEVNAKQKVSCEFLLHFAGSSLSVKDKTDFLVASKHWKLLITDRNNTEPGDVAISEKPAFDELNRPFLARRLSVKKDGKQVRYHFLIRLMD